MVTLKQLLSVFLICVLPLLAVGQCPAHFFLGEEELSGVDIYDIHQDSNLDYWIASNEGIYKYDGYDFLRMECDEMLSPSLFNIGSDNNNNIYCHNLSGQIFKITNDTCKLFYQVPDSLMSADIELIVDRKNQIFIATQCVIRIQPSGEAEILSKQGGRRGPLQIKNDGLVHFIIYDSIPDVRYGDFITPEGISYTRYFLSSPRPAFLTEVNHKSEKLIFDNTFGTMYKAVNKKLIPVSQFDDESRVLGIFEGQNSYWSPLSTRGVFRFSELGDINQNKFHFFEDYKISACLEDNEGNILLGTFKNGIIIIPKTEVTDIDFGQATVNQIATNNADELVFALADGRCGTISPSGKAAYYDFNYGFPIEFMGYLPHENEFFLGNLNCQRINFNKGNSNTTSLHVGTFKDIKHLSGGQYLLATSEGIRVYRTGGVTKNPITELPFQDPLCKLYTLCKLYNGRAYKVEFDSINKVVYASCSAGLKRIDKDGTHDIRVNNRQILGRDILYLNGRIYISINANGLLVIENGEIIEHWTAHDYLISDNTGLITTDGTNLILTTDKGIQILSPKGETIRFLNKSDGLYADRIVDMELQGSNLWVLHQKGLQKIDLEKLNPHDFKPKIELEAITVNDAPKLMSNTPLMLDYFENKIAFKFNSKSLKYRSEIQYQYHLKGIDEEWQVLPYTQNEARYKTLPPGQYTFEIFATCRDSRSETISYPFTILAPFWTKWWFYTFIGLGLFIILYLIFWTQLKKQKRKAKLREELHESKLTAIQAQMNPHFIFNSLNSIQDLVLKNDAEKAYNYISKFALLVRNTLSFSDRDFVDFSDEIASLELYLSLEKLRFKADFTYEISADHINEISIPPMLIQPFIENALVHGLLHQSGHKKLELSFQLTDILTCTITDNGIGRAEAKKIQKRQYENHKSFALSAIKKRLEILTERYNGTFEVIFEDRLVDDKPVGTKVTLKIPYITYD